jgi:hypothetical protein
MNAKDKLPREIYTIIDATIESLEKKCYPCKIIMDGKMITERKMISDEDLAEKANEPIKKLAAYIFAKGVLEGENLQNAKNKDLMLSYYGQKVRFVEARIDSKGNVHKF